jgi:hypothetical protein
MSVTDMLIAILNCCTKEELEEEEETPMITPESPELEQGQFYISSNMTKTDWVEDEDNPERRQVIKNKILAVGRMSRVFSLLRLVSLNFASDRANQLGRNRNVYPNSRVCLVRISCLLVCLHLGRRVSRRQSRALMMRKLFFFLEP